MLVRSGFDNHGAPVRQHAMFLYLGRRGLSRFTLELARCIAAMPDLRATFCISRQNEIFDEFARLGCRLLPVNTFETAGGALGRGYRVRTVYRDILGELTSQRSAGVVTLMPHVWTPLFAPFIRRQGFRYLTIIHDAHRHPGDPAGVLNSWALRDALTGDPVIALSRSVTEALSAAGTVPYDKLVTLFHPDLEFPSSLLPQAPAETGPFRILFFGRILAHDGLPLLLDAIEMLRADGFPVQLGVFGDGPLEPWRDRLRALDAEVQNRWIADHEVGDVFSRHHAVALPHIECSQSGVAAAALGLGLPLVGHRVGGLADQLRDGETGVVAETADAASFAGAIRRLASDRELYASIRARIRQSRSDRSMRRFAEHLVALATHMRPLPGPRNRRLAWV